MRLQPLSNRIAFPDTDFRPVEQQANARLPQLIAPDGFLKAAPAEHRADTGPVRALHDAHPMGSPEGKKS